MKRLLILWILGMLFFAGQMFAQDSLNVRRVGQLDIVGYAYDVKVVGNLAYVAAGESGLQIVDIADPSSPVVIGFYDTPGNAYRVAIEGNYACVVDGTYGLRVIDVTDPSSPAEIGYYAEPLWWNVRIVMSGSHAFAISEGEGLLVFDIANPTSPAEIGYYAIGSPEDIAVSGNYVYIANLAIGLP
jgi:hypothetical protein